LYHTRKSLENSTGWWIIWCTRAVHKLNDSGADAFASKSNSEMLEQMREPKKMKNDL
jgi:hypothetical protein